VLSKRALSAVEVVVGVVLLAVVALLTMPKFSAAAPAPAAGAQLGHDLRVLRVAIEMYYQDHGHYPGQTSDGTHPAGSFEAFAQQLMGRSNARGTVAPNARDAYPFGPYLASGIPPSPVPPRAGQTRVFIVTSDGTEQLAGPAPAAGWVYECATGRIRVNSGLTDDAGRPYASY
jgi:type II secretory pathway pseudopilin PulG